MPVGSGGMEIRMKEIVERRSIRHFEDRPVEAGQVEKLLESARLAPSGSNTQPWNFIVVRNREMIEKLAWVTHKQKWLAKAPLLLVCVADSKRRFQDEVFRPVDDYSTLPELKMMIRDSAIAMEHISLEAVHLGLGTCWACWFEQKDVRPILHVPEDHYVVGLIAVGYPDEAPEPRPRKSMEEMVRYEMWEQEESGQ